MDQDFNSKGDTDRKRSIQIQFPTNMHFDYAMELIDKYIPFNDIYCVQPRGQGLIQVTLKNVQTAQKYADKYIEFPDGKAQMVPVERVYKLITIRGLPFELSNECVARIFEKYGHVEFCEGEKDPRWKWYNGNRRMKISPKSEMEIPNIVQVGNYRALVQYPGVRYQCRRCLDYNHHTNECEVPFCGKCRLLGHEYKLCPYNLKVQENEQLKDVNEEFQDDVKKINLQKENEEILQQLREKEAKERKSQGDKLNLFENMFAETAKPSNDKQRNKDKGSSPYTSDEEGPSTTTIDAKQRHKISIFDVSDEESLDSIGNVLQEAILEATQEPESNATSESVTKEKRNFQVLRKSSSATSSPSSPGHSAQSETPKTLMSEVVKSAPMCTKKPKKTKDCEIEEQKITEQDLPWIKQTQKKKPKSKASASKNLFSDCVVQLKNDDFSPKKTRHFTSTPRTPKK